MSVNKWYVFWYFAPKWNYGNLSFDEFFKFRFFFDDFPRFSTASGEKFYAVKFQIWRHIAEFKFQDKQNLFYAFSL